MYGKVKNIWDIKSGGGNTNILESNNTFTGKNTFENTGSIIKVKTTGNEAFGVEFDNSSNQPVAYVGANPVGNEQKAVFYGSLGLQLKTPNKDININSGSGHLLADSTKNWNQYLDNSILRSKDLKWTKITQINYTSVRQPDTNWNRLSWNWTLGNLVSTNGIIELLLVISWADNETATLKTSLMWKNGLASSKSHIFNVEKNDRTYSFKFNITNENKLYIETKHDNAGTQLNIGWVRCWIRRGLNQPAKVNDFW